MARAPRVKRTFHQELVLNRWMLSHFKGGSLSALKERLGEDRHEGIDDDGQTRFFHELTRNLFDMDRISEAELRRYDLNIVRHWQAITHRRNAADGVILTLKYFQYLSLLFAEIYLDWYFNRRQQLLDGLNEQMAAYRLEPGSENFRDYTADDLNKLAFWNATGSGKTLLLHVNIHQYLHYFQAGKTNVWPDRIILLTPNEGLSRQHLEEFRLSGLNAHLFDKNQSDSLYKGWIDVIEVTKLAEEMGDKTVATDAFEGNNLVLVDEGHRGAGTAGGVWMARRAALVRGGFAFEYSATFSQSVAKGATVEKAEQDILNAKARRQFARTYRQLDESEQAQVALTSADHARARIEGVREAYAKAVLIDYSYKYFYADGYGKESLILNLDDAGYDKHGALYFTACLLSFYQQLWLWDTHRDRIAEFNIDKPLWVFVGNTVSGEDSDVLAVLEFLASFLNDDGQAIEWIADLIADKARLLDPKGNDVFAGRFSPLMQRDAETIYADILRRLFNAEARQRLKLVNLKGSKGELALRVGNAPHFGVINIGDDAGFFKTAEDVEAFDTETDDFGSGLFSTINQEGSKLNVLIGSRKFTEGWSSWRVSTMGLLNMGQGEGSQIIQLFGRGVRLKGKGMSLKRSLPHERPKGVHLERLETLNIFGVRANYMAAFKDYLKEEGITPSDEIIELDFPTKSNLPAGKRLKTLKLKDGYKDNQIKGFKRTHFPWLYEVPADFVGKIKQPHATLDLYEGQFYDVAYITDDHGSMLKLYQFEIDATDDGREYETKLKVLKDLVAAGKIGEASQWNAPHMVAISFARHLYYPLMAPDVTGNLPLKMRPLAFDSPSEVQFVRDLEAFYNSSVAKELLAGRSLYLLRNADTQAKGLGFARAGNFYPDFLLWLVDDATGQQWLSFVDPKGIRNLDLNDPKLGLYSEIKEREKELDDPDLILNAFILSYTRYSDLLNVGTAGSKADLEACNVLFMDDGSEKYLSKMLKSIGAVSMA